MVIPKLTTGRAGAYLFVHNALAVGRPMLLWGISLMLAGNPAGVGGGHRRGARVCSLLYARRSPVILRPGVLHPSERRSGMNWDKATHTVTLPMTRPSNWLLLFTTPLG